MMPIAILLFATCIKASTIYYQRNKVIETDSKLRAQCAAACACDQIDCIGFITEAGGCTFLMGPESENVTHAATSPCYYKVSKSNITMLLKCKYI